MMNYKIFFIIFLFIFACVPIENNVNTNFEKSFKNLGFGLVFSDELYDKNLVSEKLDARSLNLFQKNLKQGTKVRVTNIQNNKSVIAVVGKKSKYPLFYNSVISSRIAQEIEIDQMEPYIEIIEIDETSIFVANKTKTFEEEREVAQKAPVDEIGILDLSKKKIMKNSKDDIKHNFEYIIKIADFYFLESAKDFRSNLKNHKSIMNIKINRLSKTKFRVYLGPYKTFESLKKKFNDLQNIIEFENLEIIKL